MKKAVLFLLVVVELSSSQSYGSCRRLRWALAVGLVAATGLVAWNWGDKISEGINDAFQLDLRDSEVSKFQKPDYSSETEIKFGQLGSIQLTEKLIQELKKAKVDKHDSHRNIGPPPKWQVHFDFRIHDHKATHGWELYQQAVDEVTVSFELWTPDENFGFPLSDKQIEGEFKGEFRGEHWKNQGFDEMFRNDKRYLKQVERVDKKIKEGPNVVSWRMRFEVENDVWYVSFRKDFSSKTFLTVEEANHALKDFGSVKINENFEPVEIGPDFRIDKVKLPEPKPKK